MNTKKITIKVGSRFVNIYDIYQGVIVSGIPGSENVKKVLSAIIKTLIQNNHSLCIYDHNYPSLTSVMDEAVREVEQNKIEKEQLGHTQPYIILDLNDIQHSVQINPIHPSEIESLADANHIAELLVQSLVVPKEDNKISFFESVTNLVLTAAIYYWVKHYPKKADLPHVFWFLIGNNNLLKPLKIMMKDPELEKILSVFKPQIMNNAVNELEAMFEELIVRIARISTPESYWIFSGKETPKTLSKTQSEEPLRLVIANQHGLHNQVTVPWYNFALSYITRYFIKNGTNGNAVSSVIIEGMENLYIPKLTQYVATARAFHTSLILNTDFTNHLKDVYNIDCIPNLIVAGRSQKKAPISLQSDIPVAKQRPESIEQKLAKNWNRIKIESEAVLEMVQI